MLEKLRAELTMLAEQMARQQKIESMLESLREEERSLSERERRLFESLKKEQADVERLEKSSVTSVLYSMLGKKEERLDKEQQEAYAAKLKYDAVVRQLDDCRGRMETLNREKAGLSGCERRYDQVFDQIHGLLRQGGRYADQICSIEREIGENTAQLKELDEAISAGRAVMDQIGAIEKSLDSAEGWGTWDLIGGGLISFAAKHSHLDDAQAGAEYLQTLLNRFRTELSDVRMTAELGRMDTDGFLRFADWFFDGLIADWAVLSHIHDSQESVTQVKGQVQSALSKLQTLRQSRVSERAVLDKRLSDLVRNA